MKFLVAAVFCAISDNDDIHLDPDHKQCANAKAQMTFVFDSVQKNVVAVHTIGKYSVGQYNDAMAMCREASTIPFQFYKNAVEKFAKAF